MAKKTKTLGDYISFGIHEFVAFVKDEGSLWDGSRSNCGTHGNNLGKRYLGVLVCERKIESERDEKGNEVKFFYKDNPIYEQDSNISYRTFSYDSKIDSENPLAISTSFSSGNHLNSESKGFEEAKELLEKYGLY